MKKYFLILCILLFMLEVITSCKDMNDIYRDFVVPGGIIYTGRVKSPVVYPGHNRVKVSWLLGADPNVAKARFFWNNNTDSLEVFIAPNIDTVNVIINNLEEGFYSFYIKTYDEEDNSSVPVEVSGSVYGEKYQNGLLNRPVLEGILNKGIVTIQWGNADISNGAVASEIKYVNIGGNMTVTTVLTDEYTTSLLDYDIDSESLEVRTIYVPSIELDDSTYITSIDTFYTDFSKVIVSMDLTDLGGLMLAQYYGDSFAQNISKLVDNDVNTKYLVRYSSVWVTFQQPIQSLVSGYALTSANDVPDRDPKNWTFEGSNDGVTWVLLDSRNNEDFTNRFQRRYFNISGNKDYYTYYRLNMTIHSGSIFQLAELEIFGSGGGGYHIGYPEYNDQYVNSSPPKEYLPPGNLSLLAGNYMFDNAGIFKDVDDKVNGLWAWRFASGNSSDAYVQMNFDVVGAKKVTFLYAKWSDPNRPGTIKLEYSIDQGVSWIKTGDEIEVTNDELQLATYELNIQGSVRFRIVKLGRGVDSTENPNGIVNIDNFAIYNK